MQLPDRIGPWTAGVDVVNVSRAGDPHRLCLRVSPGRGLAPLRLRHLALVAFLVLAAVQNVTAQSPSLVLSETALQVQEAGSAGYTVKLATQPSGDVTVSIGGVAGTDLSLVPASRTLTFTNSDYDTAQTVTVRAATDDDATNDSATLTHTATGGGYDSVSAALPVTVTDTTRMRLEAIVEHVTEGESKPIRAMLPMPLDEDVTVTVTVTQTGGRSREFELSTNTTLTIAAGTTESTGEVVFTAVDDFTRIGIGYFNATLTPDHPRVDADTASFVVNEDDNTTAGLQVTPSRIFENGGEATLRAYKLGLHEGVVKMTVSVEPSDRASLSGTTLTFEPGALYATETLTITAVDNDTDESNQTLTITATVTEGRGVQTPRPVQLTIVDDDGMAPELALVLSPPGVREGTASTVTATASGPLSAEATLTVSASPGHPETTTDDFVLSGNTVLTIPAGGTRSTGTVTIGSVDDDLNTGRRRVVTVSATVTGGGGVAAPRSERLTILEDDDRVLAGLTATPSTLAEGETSTITLQAVEPVPADATVTVTTSSDAVELSANPVLTIAAGETESTGVVTLTALDDADSQNEVVLLRGTPSSDSLFLHVNYGAQVYVLDNDGTRLVVAPMPQRIFEGKTSTIIADLRQPSTDNVTVTIGVDEDSPNHTAAPGDYTLSANRTLTIPAGSMRSTGEVTLTATDDDYRGPQTVRVVLDIESVTGIAESQILMQTSGVTIVEDEATPRLTLEVAPASISENGGRSTVKATLNTAVEGEVRVTVRVAPAGTADADDFTQTGTQLTIPAGQKTSTGTVTITAVDDDVDGPDKHLVVTASVDVVGMEESGIIWHPFAEGLTIRDDDESGLTVSPPAVTIDEGNDGSYTVELNSEPASAVEVSVSGASGTDLTLSTSSLTFTPTDWDVPQRVTVTAGQDEDASDDMELLTHTASNSEYGSYALPVTVIDDEGVSQRIRLEVEPDQVMEDAGSTSVIVRAVLTAGPRQSATMVAVMVEEQESEYAVSQARMEIEIPVGATTSGDDFVLTPVDDDEARPDREIGVSGENGSGIPVDGTVLRLLDDDVGDRPPPVDVPGAPDAAPDAAETPEDTPIVVDVLSNDRDPDGDRLRIAAVGAAQHGTTAAAAGGIRYAPDLNWHGRDRFSYTVSDPGGLTGKAVVTITVLPVNDPPEAEDDEAETLEDEAALVEVLANDTDVDGDPIRVVSVGAARNGSTTMTPRRVRYEPDLNWYGTDRFTYTIADLEGLTATATVTMTVLPVNDAPEAVGAIPEQALEEGGAPGTVDLTPFFTDVDGDALTYTAVSSDETAVTATVAGATLTLTAVVAGTATVTVTAHDVEGLTATQTFGVRVGDRLVRSVLTDTLAALGRGHLSSARSTIGRRLETGRDATTRVVVGGQFLSPGAWDRIGAAGLQRSHALLFRAAQLQQRRSATDLTGTSAVDRLGGFGAAGLVGGSFSDWGRVLQGTDVLLSFGGRDAAARPSRRGGTRWTVWGQGDLQRFRGAEAADEGYDGDLRTAYLGLDARLGERWLVGAAVGRSGGRGDWRVGSSGGRLTTALTVVHPYLRWRGGDTSVWALAGVGVGTAENVRTRIARRGTGALGLGLGLVEGRRRLATTRGGVTVELRAEASWARLRTGAGEETVDGLEAGVRRVRTGVEMTLALDGPGAVDLAPFGAVSTRHDGGAGQTGVGLEVAGGMRLTGGRVRIEAQGRRLVLHTATAYEESGVSVTASVGAGQHDPGLSLSVRPRWGAPGHGAEALWHDQLESYPYGAERDDAAVDARVGYGMRLPGGRLLTPFGGYGQAGTGRRLQAGANLGVLGLFGGNLDSPLQLELVGERYIRPRGGADHRFLLFAIVHWGP